MNTGIILWKFVPTARDTPAMTKPTLSKESVLEVVTEQDRNAMARAWREATRLFQESKSTRPWAVSPRTVRSEMHDIAAHHLRLALAQGEADGRIAYTDAPGMPLWIFGGRVGL